ncbi:MAG: hypothetical protein KF766_05785 [Rhodocyclaceae bacterium]|nr:hypothetical protein [Rhodocyclaceae bacterium]
MQSNLKMISPDFVRQAAEETANPEAVVKAALENLDTEPDALYHDNVIVALKAIRQNDEAAYTRLIIKADGHKTRLDRLTRPEREESDHSASDRIIQIVKERCTLGHDVDGRAVAVIDDGRVRQVWHVDSHGFQEWLRAAYFEVTQKGINANALETAIATIAAIGRHQGAEVTVSVRCARHGAAYFIDMCDDAWRAIRVDQDGWDVVERPPVLFTRTKNMRPIPEPRKSGALDKLWENVNIPEDQRLMLLTWLLDAYRPDTPFPILELSGEQGSAKSSTQRRLRDLIDPNKVALRGRPKTVEDIYVGAANNWIVSFENLSHLTPEQQDALCTLATGGGYASRQFYTNGDEFVLETKRPVIINGIAALASQPDLIERVISIEAPTIPPNMRQDDQTLDARWQADYPFVMAGLLDLFSAALGLLPKIKLAEKHRLADYQLLGEAVSRAMGRPNGHFTRIFGEAVGEGVERALETYGVAHALQVFVNGLTKPWEGTVMALLGELAALHGVDRSNWPKSPRGLSGQLKRLAPGLRRRGIIIDKPTRTRNGATVRISVSGRE